jgi:CheY-like chemotaxis protein
VNPPDPNAPRSCFSEKTDFAPSDSGFRLRVLVVDDTLINRQVIGLMLSNLGCMVEYAHNGVEALAHMRREIRPDLVFMDCMMPVLDGFDAARNYRDWEIESGLERLPIVALTARADGASRQLCAESGMDGFLTKPVVLEDLKEWVTYRRTGQAGVRVVQLADQEQQPTTLFDETSLLDRLDGDRNIAAMVVQMYLNDLQRYTQDIVTAIANVDMTATFRAAHLLAGASGNVSASALWEFSRELENWAAQGALSDVLGSTEALQRLSAETEKVLRRFIDTAA